MAPNIQSLVLSETITKLGVEAVATLTEKYPDDVVTREASKLTEGGTMFTASVVVLTERQAYTIALSQRFSPFNADLQTLDELRQNARRYAPDLLRLLIGE